MQQCLQLTSKEGFANLGGASTAPSSHIQCLLPLSVLTSYLLSLAHSVPPTMALLFFQLPEHLHLLFPLPETLFLLIATWLIPLTISISLLKCLLFREALPDHLISNNPSIFPFHLALLYCPPELLSPPDMIYLLVHVFFCLSLPPDWKLFEGKDHIWFCLWQNPYNWAVNKYL